MKVMASLWHMDETRTEGIKLMFVLACIVMVITSESLVKSKLSLLLYYMVTRIFRNCNLATTVFYFGMVFESFRILI